jgi:hypothetical protein
VKYQVAIIGPSAPRFGPIMRARLLVRVRELGATLPSFVQFIYSTGTRRYRIDPKAPLVGVYFGGKSARAADLRLIQEFLRLSAVVLPVVNDLSHFRRDVPPALREINGIARVTHGSGFYPDGDWCHSKESPSPRYGERDEG